MNSLFNYDHEWLEVLAKTRPEITHLVGIDEVGRGSLIGPVVAAAVCWQWPTLTPSPHAAQHNLAMLNDSKKLSPTLRQRLLPLIQASATCSVGQACLEEIEQLNIYHASILASFRALKSLTQQLNIREHQLFVLLDGKGTLPDWPKSQQQPIIKGDTLSASIAAASIVAKEARDDYIREISQHHPQYGWHQNMGYGTVKHKLAIQQHGITPYHRQSFKL